MSRISDVGCFQENVSHFALPPPLALRNGAGPPRVPRLTFNVTLVHRHRIAARAGNVLPLVRYSLCQYELQADDLEVSVCTLMNLFV